MILWTVMPLDVVFPPTEATLSYEEIEVDGTKLIVERLSVTEAKVIRVISSNPADFLNPNYQPGTRLTYSIVHSALS
jgi:hypothetical protein